MTTHHQRLDRALTHMEWFSTTSHSLHNVIGIYAEVLVGKSMRWRHGATNDAMVDALKAASYDGAGGGKSGHSDPTADQALRHHPDAIDETIAQMRHAETHLYETALELCHHLDLPTTTGPDGNPWSGLHGAVMLTTRVRAHLPAEVDDPHTVGAIVDLADTAAWLHEKAQWIWTSAKGDALPVAEQKPLDPCRVCGPWHAPHARPPHAAPGAKGRCQACNVFFGNHGFDRIEGIWKRAEYGKGPTPAQMIEARAAGKGDKQKAAQA